MENKALYTRCPTCNTAFKVTDKLLGLAGGKVRCGACLAIFQATDYMLKPSKTYPGEDQNIESVLSDASTQQKPLDTLSETNHPESQPNSNLADLVEQTNHLPDPQASEPNLSESNIEDVETPSVDEDFDDANLIEPSISEPEIEQIDAIEDSTLSEAPPADEQEDITSADDSPQNEHFEQDQLVEENAGAEWNTQDSSSEVQESINLDSSSNQSEQGSLDLPEFQPDSELLEEDPSFDEEAISETDDPQMDYQSIDDQLDEVMTEFDEDEQDVDFGDENTSFDSDNSAALHQPFESEANDEIEQWNEIEDLDDFENTDEFDDYQENESFDELSHQLNEQMQDTDSDPDPLDEFNDIVVDNKKGMKIKLALISTLILLTIAIISIWTNRQAIAWSESWGSTMISTCKFLPCQLQPRRDVSKIKLLQRQLSPHEELENVLDVKVLLVNEASFSQPYPTIKLIFSNKNGEPVSTKYFAPADYLDTQSVDELMPTASEVHIHFETEVAGPDALGFEFIFE